MSVNDPRRGYVDDVGTDRPGENPEVAFDDPATLDLAPSAQIPSRGIVQPGDDDDDE